MLAKYSIKTSKHVITELDALAGSLNSLCLHWGHILLLWPYFPHNPQLFIDWIIMQFISLRIREVWGPTTLSEMHVLIKCKPSLWYVLGLEGPGVFKELVFQRAFFFPVMLRKLWGLVMLVVCQGIRGVRLRSNFGVHMVPVSLWASFVSNSMLLLIYGGLRFLPL